MSLKSQPIPPVPEATAHSAKRAFPKGNIFVQMREVFGSLYTDDQFQQLYPADGQRAYAAWRLALVTIMQAAEGLTDRQAADAVRSRIDWKYALSLEIDDPGFDFSILSEFRARLVKNKAANLLLNAMLEQCVEQGLVKQHGKQRTDSVAICASTRQLNRLEMMGETMRNALETLAVAAPVWLRKFAPAEWLERYSARFEGYRLPKSKAKRNAMMKQIGADAQKLYETMRDDAALSYLCRLPALEVLRQVWLQRFWVDNDKVKAREPSGMPPRGDWICSPYDPEASYGRKRESSWVGYKTHITETCDDDMPRVITQVETGRAIERDRDALGRIQQDLVDKGLPPKQHLVDAGYTSVDQLIESEKERQIELIGPIGKDTRWQARDKDRYDVSRFHIDWVRKQAICPQGEQSRSWSVSTNKAGKQVVGIAFRKASCLLCETRAKCTTAERTGRRLQLRYPAERHERLQAARREEGAAAFKETYKRRSGIEGTISQMLRNTDMRQTRYIGMGKTHLQVVASAVATNILRVIRWLSGKPLAKSRVSRFAAMYA